MIRTAFENIPQAAILSINNVVVKDEGGWSLNAVDPNDPDGGWTFGGVTAKRFNAFYETNLLHADIEMVVQSNNALVEFQHRCYVFYYEEYYKPLAQLHAIQHVTVQDYELSAAINVGMDDVHKWILICGYSHKAFIAQWRRHYVQLVVENAKAWRNYADAVANRAVGKDFPAVARPKSFRAKYLQGWMNRVDRYS